MGVITLALITAGHLPQNAPIPDLGDPRWRPCRWRFGTYFGGWRIIHTLGTKVIHLDPIHGFAAETSSAAVIYTRRSHFGFPISTTQIDHRLDHGRGRDRRPVGRQVGRRRQHRLGLGPHHPRRRRRGRRRLRSSSA